jgi:DNA-binding MarR family transcriptional regulator
MQQAGRPAGGIAEGGRFLGPEALAAVPVTHPQHTNLPTAVHRPEEVNVPRARDKPQAKVGHGRYPHDLDAGMVTQSGLGGVAAFLTRLHKHGPQTLTELSEHDRVSPASMSQTVNRLTSAGYAVRTRDPDDRRKVLFSATAEGDELASAARAKRNAWLDQRLQALSTEDRAVIARATALLSSIADS